MPGLGHDEAGAQPTVRLRPGMVLPDWSAARAEVARAALGAAFDAFGMAWKLSGIDEAEDRIWLATLRLWARNGRAPTHSEVAEAAGLPPEEAAHRLRRLRDRDLVVLGDGGEIAGAYPFTAHATEHRVRLPAGTVTAMCAIDALGMGAMLDADAAIRSTCRHCGQPIEIATGDRGRRAAAVSPETAIVWSGVHDAGDCAATSLCTVQAFFCRDGHLQAWRARGDLGTRGFRLSMNEALQVGRAIFGPILAVTDASATQARGDAP